jgi:hypothetical protein
VGSTQGSEVRVCVGGTRLGFLHCLCLTGNKESLFKSFRRGALAELWCVRMHAVTSRHSDHSWLHAHACRVRASPSPRPWAAPARMWCMHPTPCATPLHAPLAQITPWLLTWMFIVPVTCSSRPAAECCASMCCVTAVAPLMRAITRSLMGCGERGGGVELGGHAWPPSRFVRVSVPLPRPLDRPTALHSTRT